MCGRFGMVLGCVDGVLWSLECCWLGFGLRSVEGLALKFNPRFGCVGSAAFWADSLLLRWGGHPVGWS